MLFVAKLPNVQMRAGTVNTMLDQFLGVYSQ